MLDPNIKKIYLAYKNMLDRCYNPGNASYKHYGGRGIEVCAQWVESRDAFVAWAKSSGHSMGLSLDRISTDGNYSPENCRWSTIREQLLNQRRNHLITYQDVTQPLTIWAEQIGVSVDTLFRRIKVYKMPVSKALTPKSLRGTASCGTRYMYEKGCRCDQCRAAHTERHRELRQRRKQREGVER